MNYIRIQTNIVTTTWKTYIYRSQMIGGYPADSIDCMNQCLNIDSNFCYVFVFEKGICYLGRKDFSNGTVAANYSSITMNIVISKYKQSQLLTVDVFHRPQVMKPQITMFKFRVKFLDYSDGRLHQNTRIRKENASNTEFDTFLTTSKNTF